MPSYADIGRMFTTLYEEMTVNTALVKQLLMKVDEVANELKRMTDEVTRSKTVGEGVIALVESLQQQLKDLANSKAAQEANAAAPGDTAKIVDEINALADQLGQQTDALSAAMTKNTVAANEGSGGTDPMAGGNNENPTTPRDPNSDLTQPPVNTPTPGDQGV